MKTFIIIFLLSAIFIVNTKAQSDTSLVAWWHFDDGTASDHSGNGNHGILVNNPKLIPGVNKKGLAFEFQGYGTSTDQGSHILLPMLDFKKMGEFTIMFWAKFYGVTHIAGESFIFFGDHSRGWLGIINHVKQPAYDGILYIQYGVGSDLDYGNKPFEIIFDNKISNTWFHCALVYKKGEIRAFLNGKLIGRKQQNINIIGNKAGMARHWWLSETSTRLNGAIDDVRVYSRPLKDDEIQGECDETAFKYENFSSSSTLIFNKDSKIVDNKLVLTDSKPWQSSSVWHNEMVPVKIGFKTTFAFRNSEGVNKYTKEDIPGADGICFVIQNTSPNEVGSGGGNLGFNRIPNSFVIEFDTYKNYDDVGYKFYDPNENHLGVFCNGTFPNSPEHNSPSNLATVDTIMTIVPDGRIYYVKIEYDPLTHMTIFLDTLPDFKLPPVLVLDNIDISKMRMLNLKDGEYAWVGFTSATGNAQEKHEILSWEFCPFPTEFYIDVVDEKSQVLDNSILVSPNPMSDITYFDINLARDENVVISIYDILGTKLTTLVNDNLQQGNHRINWFATYNNKSLPSGIYLYVIKIGNDIKTGKIIIN